VALISAKARVAEWAHLEDAEKQGRISRPLANLLHGLLQAINQSASGTIHFHWVVHPEGHHIFSFEPERYASVQRNIGISLSDLGGYMRIGIGFRDKGDGIAAGYFQMLQNTLSHQPAIRARFDRMLATLPHGSYAELPYGMPSVHSSDIMAASMRSGGWAFYGSKLDLNALSGRTTADFARLAHTIWQHIQASHFSSGDLII
jgi:hypothetical protein